MQAHTQGGKSGGRAAPLAILHHKISDNIIPASVCMALLGICACDYSSQFAAYY